MIGSLSPAVREAFYVSSHFQLIPVDVVSFLSHITFYGQSENQYSVEEEKDKSIRRQLVTVQTQLELDGFKSSTC